MVACQGASFTKISTFSAPGALRANHARASRHLGVRLGGLEPWGHLWAFWMFYRRFKEGDNFSYKFFGWFLFLPLSLNHEDPWKSFRPKDIQLQPQGTEKQPQNPGSWLRYRLSISCWTSTAQGRKKQHCHLSGKIWGLWIRRDESIWRINQKNGDLQNYTCAAYVNTCINK